jgi:cathepsin F
MKLILLLAALAACTLAQEDALTTAFQSFVGTYNKMYESQNEWEYRRQVFNATLELIAERNAEGEAEHGINKFADLTREEFKKMYLGYNGQRSSQPESDEILATMNTSEVSSIDWRSKTPKILTPVKDQQQCGSCWAFSATEQIETDCAMSTGKLLELSPQQIVSCDKTDDGCQGGNTETAYAYVKKAGGLELATDYPYKSGKGKTGKCKKPSKSKEHCNIKGFTTVSKSNAGEKKMVTQIQTSPISVCVDAEKWQTYKKGVIGRKCGSQLDHCVQAVGLNTDGNQAYWIVRNSWNTDWGENGYIYVAEGQDACGIAKDATIVTV